MRTATLYFAYLLSLTIPIHAAAKNKYRLSRIFTGFGLAFLLNLSGISLAVSGSLYVAGEDSGNIAVVNSVTGTVSALLDVGGNPHQPRLSPDGQYVWVAMPNLGEVARINTFDNSFVKFDTGGLSPNHMNFSPDGSSVYIANQGSSTVVKMDAVTGNLLGSLSVGTAPHGINVDANGNVWALDLTDDTATVLDFNSSAVIATVSTGAKPIGMVFSADGSLAYTSNVDGKTVSVIDTATHTNLTDKFINSAMGPMGIVLSPDGSSLWLSATPNSAVLKYDIETAANGYLSFNQTIFNLYGAHGLDINEDGTTLFTTLKLNLADPTRNGIGYIDANTGIASIIGIEGAENLHGLVYVSSIPVPAAVWLFGSGLVGLVGIARRKKAA